MKVSSLTGLLAGVAVTAIAVFGLSSGAHAAFIDTDTGPNTSASCTKVGTSGGAPGGLDIDRCGPLDTGDIVGFSVDCPRFGSNLRLSDGSLQRRWFA